MKRAGTAHATVVAYLALIVALSGTAVAATGGNLKLGLFNRAGETTVLKSKLGSALDLRSEAGVAPLRVNSDTKVDQLNADELDSLDSSDLQRRVTGACAQGTFVQSISADGSVVCGAPPSLSTYQRFASGTASGPFDERSAYVAAFCDEGDYVVGGGYSYRPRSNINVNLEGTIRQFNNPTSEHFADYEGHDGYEVGWTDDIDEDPSQVWVIALCMRHP